MALDKVKVSLERKSKIFLIEILCGILLQFNYLDATMDFLQYKEAVLFIVHVLYKCKMFCKIQK